MALERSARPLARCLRCTRHNRIPSRSISATPWRAQEETTTTEPPASAESPPPPPPSAEAETDALGTINPRTVSNRRRELRLIRDQGKHPIGSRRRRAALASSANIPFEELPYQCFQEARRVLQTDRAEKVTEIGELRSKIAKWTAAEVPPEREAIKEKRIKSWGKEIERLKVLADINDPLVKKRFEDGFGDMNKPIYRHLADLKWRSHSRQILMQRITQMDVVPDILPAIDPTVSTSLAFGRSKVQHGDFVLASTSEQPPTLDIQSYEKGEKLVTIAIVTPDVPNVEKDAFDYRCHFLAANVMITPTKRHVDLARLSRTNQVIQDWLPPYSQKGAPYQRLAVFVLEQPSSVPEPGAKVEAPVEEAEASKTEIVGDAARAPEATSSASSNEAVKSDATEAKETPPATAGPEAASTEPTPSQPEPPATPSETSAASNTATDDSNTLFSFPTTNTPATPQIDPNAPVPERLSITAIKSDKRYSQRSNFILRSFATKYRLRPIGVDLFRAQWDETTEGVMRRNGIVGADVEFKRKRVDPLPYKRLDGGRYR